MDLSDWAGNLVFQLRDGTKSDSLLKVPILSVSSSRPSFIWVV